MADSTWELGYEAGLSGCLFACLVGYSVPLWHFPWLQKKVVPQKLNVGGSQQDTALRPICLFALHPPVLVLSGASFASPALPGC